MLVRPILRLLAERSRRGQVASWVLAAVAVAGVAVVFVALFPGRESPRLSVGLASGGPDVDYPSPLTVWPGTRVLVRGERLTGGGSVDLLVAGRNAGTFVVAPDGHLRGVVEVPEDLPSGETIVTVEDVGTGRSAGAVLDVQDPAQPAAFVNPAAAPSGASVVLAAGGLPPDTAVQLVLDPDARARVLRTRRTTLTGLLVVVMHLPPVLPPGEHAVSVQTPSGQRLAPPARVAIEP